MRITLNDKSRQHLLSIMSARGIKNPTHMLNVLLAESDASQTIPAKEDANDKEHTREAA